MSGHCCVTCETEAARFPDRHVLGYLGRPTRDGRVLTEVAIKECGHLPVTSQALTAPVQVVEVVGDIFDIRIEAGALTCATSATLLPDQRLAGELLGVPVPQVDGTIHVAGSLVGAHVIPADAFAWDE